MKEKEPPEYPKIILLNPSYCGRREEDDVVIPKGVSCDLWCAEWTSVATGNPDYDMKCLFLIGWDCLSGRPHAKQVMELIERGNKRQYSHLHFKKLERLGIPNNVIAERS